MRDHPHGSRSSDRVIIGAPNLDSGHQSGVSGAPFGSGRNLEVAEPLSGSEIGLCLDLIYA